MAEKKLADTKFIKVKVSNRNPEAEMQSTFVGGNNVVINGKEHIKHYRLQMEQEVMIPESFAAQLDRRSAVAKDKTGNPVKVPMYIVERI